MESKNVIADHPEVAEKLKAIAAKHYKTWWKKDPNW